MTFSCGLCYLSLKIINVRPTPVIMKCFRRLDVRPTAASSQDSLQFMYHPNLSVGNSIMTTFHLALTHPYKKGTDVRMLFIDISLAFCNWIILTGRQSGLGGTSPAAPSDLLMTADGWVQNQQPQYSLNMDEKNGFSRARH